MSLHIDIKSEMIESMKAKDSVRLGVLRGLLSAFTNEAVAKGKKPDEELDDEGVLSVINRAVKQRKDSIEQFEKGGRQELADIELAELEILKKYLPEMMSQEEVHKFISSKLEGRDLDAKSKGQFMGEIMRELKGKADGGVVKEVVDKLLA